MRLELSHIFAFYASFGDRLNTSTMGPQQFKKFVRDCGLIAPGFELGRIDILMSELSNGTNLLRFDTFCESLPSLAAVRFRDMVWAFYIIVVFFFSMSCICLVLAALEKFQKLVYLASLSFFCLLDSPGSNCIHRFIGRCKS